MKTIAYNYSVLPTASCYEILQVELASSELGWPGEWSSRSSWFGWLVFEMTPESVLSSPVTDGVGVNWEPVKELAGEQDTATVGGSDFRASTSLLTASKNCR